MRFLDQFSQQSAAYKQFRPTYPKALYEFLNATVHGHALAWDAGTGNGQCAVALSEYFTRIIATDPSPEQISNATPRPNIEYRVATAEESRLPDGSVDLITVAQAAHWFDFTRFLPEVRRVLKPGGAIAIFGYSFQQCGDPALDALMRDFAVKTLGPYWAPQVRILWDDYRDIPFPFRELPHPDFAIHTEWDLKDLVGYYESWSAVQNFIKAKSYHPLRDIFEALTAAWGPPETKRAMRLAIPLRIGVAGA